MVGEEIEGEVGEGGVRVGEEGAGVESIPDWTQSFCIENGTLLFGCRVSWGERDKSHDPA